MIKAAQSVGVITDLKIDDLTETGAEQEYAPLETLLSPELRAEAAAATVHGQPLFASLAFSTSKNLVENIS